MKKFLPIATLAALTTTARAFESFGQAGVVNRVDVAEAIAPAGLIRTVEHRREPQLSNPLWISAENSNGEPAAFAVWPQPAALTTAEAFVLPPERAWMRERRERTFWPQSRPLRNPQVWLRLKRP